MSLKKESLAIESKIFHLQKDKQTKEIECDMYIALIREEVSPHFNIEELNTQRITVAVDSLINTVHKYKGITTEIKRLEKML